MILIILAGEAIVFGIAALAILRAGKTLTTYLCDNHRSFFNAKFTSPYRAGDRTVMRQQFEAVKNTYLIKMPDEPSAAMQRRLRLYMSIMISVLVLFAATLGILAFVGQNSAQSD